MDHEPTRAYYETLVQILSTIQAKSILEIGLGWGISGVAFIEAFNQLERYYSVDPNLNAKYCLEAQEEVLPRFKSKFPNAEVNFYNSVSAAALEKFISQGLTFDLIYIDGSHNYKEVIADLTLAEKLRSFGGIIIMDDVFHPKNFQNNDYGVAQALGEYLSATGREARIVPTKSKLLNNSFAIL